MPGELSQSKLARIIAAMLVLGLALFILLAALAYGQYRQESVHAASVQTSHQSLLTGAQLGQALSRMESEQRGFLLTENEAYLSGYELMRERVESLLARFQSLTAHHPDKTGIIEQIRGNTGRKIAELDETIALTRDDRRDDALALVDTDLGKNLMTDIREDAFAFRTLERESLAESQAAQRRAQRNLNGLVLASLGAGLLLSVMTVWVLRRNVLSIARGETRTARATEARDTAQHEQERVETMLQEMNHRIGNSLGMVSALMGLQRSQSDNPAVRDALAAARTRIHAVATAHRRLRLAPDMETTDLAPVLADMANDLRDTQPRQDIALNTDFIHGEVSDRDAVTLGLLMSELVVNAFKHAFHGRDGGTVWVDTYVDDDNRFVLRVQDDGIGLPGGPEADAGGLGTSVVSRMSRQFGGELDYSLREGGGTCIALTLPGLDIRRNA